MNFNETDDNFSCYIPSVVHYRYFAASWGIVVVIVGTIGNLLTVVAFASDKKLQTKFNLLIVNLTFADILYCSFLQPFSVDAYIHLHWRSGESFCRVFGLLLFVSNAVSILTLCLIAVSRYLLINNTKTFERIYSRVGLPLILLSTWAIGFGCFAPLWTTFVFVQKVCTCSFHRTRGRPYTTILLVFYFVIGLGCVGVFYFLIYRKVKKASKALDQYKIKKLSVKKNTALPSTGIPGQYDRVDEPDSGVYTGVSESQNDVPVSHENTISTEGANSAPATPKKVIVHSSQGETTTYPATPKRVIGQPSQGETISTDLAKVKPAVSKKVMTKGPTKSKSSNTEFKKVTKMCFMVFIFFVVCYLPFIFLNALDAKNLAPQILHMIAANFTWLNSCINPILYAAMNRHFKEAYKNVILGIFSRCRARR
ncbi:G-protein coupled receptor 84 [Protopterus annectens]|uniref:G-protein coupled receptor 84 n=1 Tax=Protopterus annectens TaxID=7888 RepID=UPI001CFB1B2F|nr:G-protein coupled receptor 84 [Protopterus annectens]